MFNIMIIIIKEVCWNFSNNIGFNNNHNYVDEVVLSTLYACENI